MSATRLVRAIYLVAILMMAHAAIDLLANIWPIQPGEAGWRYGSAGFLSQYALTPIFALVIIGANAWWNEHLRLLKVLAVAALVGVLVLAVALVSFSLDVVQVRPLVSPEGLSMYKVGAVKAAFKLATLGAFLLYLALAFRQAARTSAPGTLEMAGPDDLDWRPEEPDTPDTP